MVEPRENRAREAMAGWRSARAFAAAAAAASMAGSAAASDCVADWGKCGGTGYSGPTACCNAMQSCVPQNSYYSECVPKPLDPFPLARPSAWCGDDGGHANHAFGDEVSALDIAIIWRHATEGLTGGHSPGGNESCVAAVTVALGECGHPSVSDWATIYDKVCARGASGAGGLWQVTSQDDNDVKLAGCSDGFDYCCNARLAYAHAFLQGGATEVPPDYCQLEGCENGDCCGQLRTAGPAAAPWNDPRVDKARKPGARIPDCSLTQNVWYKGYEGGFNLSSVTADQEPCWFGPFSIAAGGVGRPFFAGFYGWGGHLQHYTDSKAGECDPSPQGNADSCDEGKYAGLPTYSQLAVKACAAAEPPAPPPPPPGAPPEEAPRCRSIHPDTEDAWCDANCHNQPPFCPPELCTCLSEE